MKMSQVHPHTHTSSISLFPTVNVSSQKALCSTMHSLALRECHVIAIAVSISTCEWVAFLFLLNPIRFKCANYGASEVCILARMCVNTPLTHFVHFTHTWFSNNLVMERIFCVLTWNIIILSLPYGEMSYLSEMCYSTRAVPTTRQLYKINCITLIIILRKKGNFLPLSMAQWDA